MIDKSEVPHDDSARITDLFVSGNSPGHIKHLLDDKYWIDDINQVIREQLATERAKVADLESRLMAEGERHMNAVCRFHDEKERATGIEDNLAAERAKVALACEGIAPTAWLFRALVDKHVTGDPLPGEIQIGIVWGRPGGYQVSINEPTGYIVSKTALYSLDIIQAVLQSSDALADIRREVARECAEILKGVEDRYSKHSFPMHPADVAAACVYVIRANFGVTE